MHAMALSDRGRAFGFARLAGRLAPPRSRRGFRHPRLAGRLASRVGSPPAVAPGLSLKLSRISMTISQCSVLHTTLPASLQIYVRGRQRTARLRNHRLRSNRIADAGASGTRRRPRNRGTGCIFGRFSNCSTDNAASRQQTGHLGARPVAESAPMVNPARRGRVLDDGDAPP